MPSKNPRTYIDLFSGSGGFSYGFDKEGFQNIFSVDMEPSFCETYRENFPNHRLFEKDISTLTKEEILKTIGKTKVDVIIGGPPCQGFSLAGNIGRRFIDDPRNKLFEQFARIVNIVKPNYFVLENVARLYTHNHGKTREEIIKKFSKIGYKVDCKILNSADFGVPQIRKRVIFVGSKKDKPIVFPEKEYLRPVTVREAIREFPPLESGQSSKIPNHIAMNHSFQMLSKMKHVLNGGNRSQIPSSIRPMSGDVRKYIRYASDKPSVCVTGDMRKIFHYSQNRALTVRELAKLQSFQNNFVFKGSTISQQQQVGNSVPPLMASAIARTIAKMAAEDEK